MILIYALTQTVHKSITHTVFKSMQYYYISEEFSTVGTGAFRLENIRRWLRPSPIPS